MLKRKSKTHIPCVLFIFLIWTALWSCRSQSPESFATGSGDGPLRIISTMPSTTEMLYEFGVWEQVAAISSHCESPPGQAVKPVVGTGFEPDLEQILDLQADLVVGSVVQQNAPFIGELERLGIPHHLVADQTLGAQLTFRDRKSLILSNQPCIRGHHEVKDRAVASPCKRRLTVMDEVHLLVINQAM